MSIVAIFAVYIFEQMISQILEQRNRDIALLSLFGVESTDIKLLKKLKTTRVFKEFLK